MANYSLVINSKFRPFEYQELLAPALMATQAHQAVEEAYADLATKANVWDNMINKATDQKAYDLYSNYAKDLKSYSDQLAQYGLTPTSRQAMLNMRSRYAQEITPIERAYQLRDEDIKRQQNLYDKSNGRVIFDRMAKDTSLDKYLNGVSPEYNSVNLDNVVNTGLAGGKAISSRYINTKEGKRFNGDYYSLITETGMSPEQAMEVLRGSGKYPEFERFINDTLANYGYDKYNAKDQQTIRRALNEGINLGIVHSQSENLHDNWRARQASEHYYHELEAEAAANREINKAQQLAQIKDNADRASKINTLFAPVVPQGVTGEPDTDLDRLKGLKLVVGNNGEQGVTTEKLTTLATNVRNTRKALEDWENKHSKEELARFRSYVPTSANNPDGTSTSAFQSYYAKGQSAPRGYAEWQKLHSQATEAKKAFDEEWRYLKKLEKDYSAYGDNMYDRINIGKTAKQSHLGQQKLFYGINANNSARKELKSALATLSSAGVYAERTDNGKKITGDDLSGDSGLLSDKKNTAIGVTIDRDNVFLSLNDEGGEKEYKIRGVRHIEDFNRRLSFVNKKLGDFYSPRTTGNIYNVPSNIEEGDYIGALQAAIKAGKAANPRETNMYAATVRMPVNGTSELVNIVTDGVNIYFQTLTDELYHKGMNREAQLNDAAATALVDLSSTLTGN